LPYYKLNKAILYDRKGVLGKGPSMVFLKKITIANHTRDSSKHSVKTPFLMGSIE
jgi:hypothetical protein